MKQKYIDEAFPTWFIFGEKEGFDLVIGNPPYGVSIKGDYRKLVLDNLGKVPDYEIYYFFIELTHKLLKIKGIKSLIVPKTFLFNLGTTRIIRSPV
ncbi:Eco57I restriction-modification methylase domain-containing protein, partial [Patescibacteria group bacterium]|nr:Eco57I restriction-modification methylase domain-containing protein [Patescibacteria group bacterium]